MSPSFAMITLGCPKNEVDSNKMVTKLLGAGYSFSQDPDLADAVIVNTCSFLTSAVEESLDVILSLVNDTGKHDETALSGAANSAYSDRKIIVAGCMPSRYGKDLNSELPEIAAFVCTKDEDKIVSVFDKLFERDSNFDNNKTEAQNIPKKAIRTDENLPYAYVKISDGCDKFCSYCMIPYIRGRYHSFEKNDILQEVSQLVDCGVQEIIFIGQDTGIWGSDLKPQTNIVDLLDSASSSFPNTWFRLLYIQPDGITDELLFLMSSRSNICSYLDIPLQHVNKDVLHAMNRVGSFAKYEKLINNIRTKHPNIAIRSTFMAGFPGETNAQHEELLSFINKHPFDYSGVFVFSPEDGTKAAKLPCQIDDEVRLSRAQAIQDACEKSGFSLAQARCGSQAEVIVEGFEETNCGTELLARGQFQAPEIDGQVHIAVADPARFKMGQHLKVKICGSFCYELDGELI